MGEAPRKKKHKSNEQAAKLKAKGATDKLKEKNKELAALKSDLKNEAKEASELRKQLWKYARDSKGSSTRKQWIGLKSTKNKAV